MKICRTIRSSLLVIAVSLAAGCSAGTSAAPPRPAATGSGPVSVHGGAPHGAGSQRSTGSGYSAAFASCMRAHGEPRFPDPGGSSPLAPGSGIDPGSAAFQDAVNGPCRSLAPSAWVSSGQVTGP